MGLIACTIFAALWLGPGNLGACTANDWLGYTFLGTCVGLYMLINEE